MPIDLDKRKIISVVKGKIVIEKRDRIIYKNDNIEKLVKDKFLTPEEAENAIKSVLPRAKEHFKTCSDKHLQLCQELKFSVGFHYEGDTYGIYNEYDYISFKMDSFDFQFAIND
jgi:hypothetical protein